MYGFINYSFDTYFTLSGDLAYTGRPTLKAAFEKFHVLTLCY